MAPASMPRKNQYADYRHERDTSKRGSCEACIITPTRFSLSLTDLSVPNQSKEHIEGPVASLKESDELWKEATLHLRTTLKPKEYLEVLRITSLDILLQDTSARRLAYKARRLPRFVNAATRFIQHFLVFSEVIDTYVSSNPQTAALIWGSLKLVLTLAARTYETIERVVEMLDTVSEDLPRYQEYIELFPSAPRLRNALVKTYMKVIFLNCELVRHLRRNPFLAIFRAGSFNFESRFAEIVKEVQALQPRVETELQAVHIAFNKRALDRLLKMNHDGDATSSTSARLPCHYLPFANNTRFVGRQEYLAQVSKILLPKEPPSQASTIITGLGGVGKTEIALHFVYEHINEYPVILWISAESGERMLQAYVEIARRMGLESADARSDPKRCMSIVLEWLASTSTRWLVVFDNATNVAFQDLKRSWPSGKTGSILLTTRNNEFSLRLASLDALTIEPLNAHEGGFLLRSLLSSPDDAKLIDNESSITELVRLLGGLPLALSQIAGFMKASRCPATQMLRIYQDPKNAIHIHSKPPIGSTVPYDETVATVWNISIQALSSQALALLETMSFLDPDGIPEDFLVEFKGLGHNTSTSDLDFRLVIEELATQSLIKASQPESLFRPPTLTAQIFHSSDVNISVSPSEIDNRGLVAGIPQTNISMHRLVQSQSLGLSSKQKRSQAFQNAQSMLFALSERFGVVGEADLDCNWAFYERVMPHILSLEEKYRTMQDELPFPSSLHQLLAYALMFLHGRGSYNDAIKIFPTIEKVCKEKNEPLLLTSIYDVQGDMLRNSNFAERAHEMYSKALEVLLTSDSSQDRDRMLARAYSTLGNSSLAMNDVAKSLDYHQQGLLLQEKLTTLHNELVFGNALALAYINASWAYWKSGQLDIGSEIVEKALKLIDNLNKTPNKVWARRSWGLRVLGNIRIAQGRDAEGFEIHQEAFKIQIDHFGYEHHETGDLCYKLSYHYHHFSNTSEAIKYLRAALNVYSVVALDVEVQGATSRAMYKLSVLLTEIGEVDEAREMKAKAAEIRQAWVGIPPEEKDTVEDYDFLIPYWGQ